MVISSDISETELLLEYNKTEKGMDVIRNLLKDHTTQQNIYWATDSYVDKGDGYTFYDPITIEKITGDNDKVIRPRAVKSKEEQTQRARDKAEVFTPSWVCNAQNNLIDEAWFGRSEGLFNSPDPKDPQKWINNEEKIVFPHGKSWKDYVADMRLEITCGEAPYLANRYDAVTGEYNIKAKYRIGILDRKLRIVSENTKDSKEWILWAKVALRSTYGFEWQGDNLLLAREALFFTFAEHYIEQFGERKFNQNKMRMMPGVAYIVSWNIWQMDGLKYGLPGYEPYIEKELEETPNQMSLFDNDDFYVEVEKREILPHERLCLIKDFLDGVNLKKATLSKQDFHDLKAPKVTFESLVNKKNNKTS